jgi:hypothetical protein
MRGLQGRQAIVDAVMTDLDDRIQLTVSLEDDPARTLGKGRGLGPRFFFAPAEVEPLQDDPDAAPPRVLIAGIGNVSSATTASASPSRRGWQSGHCPTASTSSTSGSAAWTSPTRSRTATTRR